MRFSTVATASTGFASIASGFVLGKRALSGEATFYGGNVAGGACSFSTYTLPSGILGTALSDSNWDNSGECGACVSVTGPSGNSITAMIVDECPGCGTNHLDLFTDAFTELADASAGVIDVTWDYVTCPITSALELHNKEGVSAYWFSMQVVNANQAVSSMEVSADGGSTWLTTTRQTYNYFEISSGTGTTTVDVKITAADGSVVTVNNVAISAGASTTASSNFGTSGTTTAVANVVSSSSSVVPTSTTEATTSTSAVEPETTSAAPATSTTEPAVFYESTSSSSTVATPTPTSTASSVGATDDDACESD